ncbi:MAG: alpha/beta hydrolase, partial [Granulosicoccus sp.]|nr:alpha/beta hydrolase [Granulosicoccus sp.]
MKFVRNSLIAGSISILLLACSDDDPKNTSDASLTWRTCTEAPELQCATLRVPMDYSNNDDSESISIGLTRLSATDPNSNEALLLNPGGPGSSGNMLLELFSELQSVPESIRAKYDLIGFDPRGVGDSTPVNCNDLGFESIDEYLVDQSAIDEYLQEVDDLYQRCAEVHGDYLLYLGSANVVRDMESIRQALNVEKMNFIGYSYGTRLAALYLTMYPEHSGRIVLDASLSPDSDVQMLASGQMMAMQRNVEALLGDCTRLDPLCDPMQLLTQLTSRVDQLYAEGNEQELELLGELLILGVEDPDFGSLLLGPLLAYLENYDAQALQDFLQLLEQQDGTDDLDEHNVAAQIAIACADDDTRPDAAALGDRLTQFNQQSDLFAEVFISVAGLCSVWPPALEPLELISTRTAPTALVIGGTSDASTPIE